MTAATHMLSAYLIVTILAAAANVYAATSDFRSPAWLLSNMKRLGVQKRWLTTLGTLKALGALGLLAGIRIPLIGVAAAAGLSVLRWRHHYSYAYPLVRPLPYPLLWLLLAVGSLVLRLRSA